MLGLGLFLAGEFEEARGRDQAPAALGEIAALRAEIEDGAAFGAIWRKAEVHRHQLDPVSGSAHHRRHVVDRTRSDCGRSSSVCCVGIPSSRSLFDPADVLFVSVAHEQNDRARRTYFRGAGRPPAEPGCRRAKPRYTGPRPSGIHP